MNTQHLKNVLFFILLVSLAIVGRLTPHLPNFTPVAATALFAGFIFQSRVVALLVPFVAMAISDKVIGAYDYRVMAAVYASFMFPVVFGNPLKRHCSAFRVLGSSAVGSAVFFFVTNWAVWYFGQAYSRDWNGLATCYVVALPFLKYTLGGNLFWSMIVFGTYYLAVSGWAQLARTRVVQACNYA